MELLYHYLWKYKVFGRRLAMTDGRRVEILSPGIHNNDAGPDFSAARIRVDDTQWAGNVEIHVKASDWYRHGHDHDPAYDSIILHVVAVDDARICRADGSEIPQLIVSAPPRFYETAAKLVSKIDNCRCLDRLGTLPPLVIEDWLETLAIERLHHKATRMLELRTQFNADWRQALFISLARALGFGLNGIPFELMAKSLPLNYVSRHSDNPIQIEALLFGQAGMLDPSVNIFDEYYQNLCREYYFLARKYNLRPIQAGLWKYSRTRPQNFPHRRIAILASALRGGFDLGDNIMECKGDPDRLRSLFQWEAGTYWKTHAAFGAVACNMPVKLSRQSIDLLLINLAAPYYYAWGAMQGDCDRAEAGADLLRDLDAENNSIIATWRTGGLKATDAMRSQALIHLRKEYCDRGRCLDCRFAFHVLKSSFQTD